MSEDPFFIVRDEVEKSLNQLQEFYENWLKLKTSNNQQQFKWTTDEIKSTLNTIEWDIQDLEETIKIVDANPQKFKLDSREIEERKRFVRRSKDTIGSIRKAVTSFTASTVSTDAAAGGGAASSSARGPTNPLASPTGYTSFNDTNIDNDNDDFIYSEKQQQMRIMRQQDENLDQIHSTVVNIKEIAHTMGNELDDQNTLLEELENKVDRGSNRLENAMKRIQRVIQIDDGDRKQFWCIVLLCIIAFILFIFLLI